MSGQKIDCSPTAEQAMLGNPYLVLGPASLELEPRFVKSKQNLNSPHKNLLVVPLITIQGVATLDFLFMSDLHSSGQS